MTDTVPSNGPTSSGESRSASTPVPPPPPVRPTSEPPPAEAPSTGPALTRRGRVRKFDRPPPPHDWRWWVGGVGKVLIATGLLMFGFVAYQLWGTGIETARAQRGLETQFEELLAETAPATAPTPTDTTPTNTAPTDTTPTDTAPTRSSTPDSPTETTAPSAGEPAAPAVAEAVPVESQNLPLFEEGDAVARIEIPAIGVDDIVVAGVQKSDLKKGPGHYPETPMPGQLGNAAIAGHRTTYGQPFHNVDNLQIGDEIVTTTVTGRYVYRVTGQQIVSPSDYQVVATTDPNLATITLTSCHPKWTAQERIIITGELDGAASSVVGEPVINYGRPLDDRPAEEIADAPATTVADADDSVIVETPVDPGTETVNAGIADAFADGWFSDPGANGQVALWGALLAAVAVLSYLISRKFRRDWVGALVGFIPFAVTMYFFFQNVNRLLPPNL